MINQFTSKASVQHNTEASKIPYAWRYRSKHQPAGSSLLYFTEGPCCMAQQYQDAMIIVRKYKRSLFIAITCNPRTCAPLEGSRSVAPVKHVCGLFFSFFLSFVLSFFSLFFSCFYSLVNWELPMILLSCSSLSVYLDPFQVRTNHNPCICSWSSASLILSKNSSFFLSHSFFSLCFRVSSD